MPDLPQRLYQTKLTLLAVIFVVVGIGLLIVARNVHSGLWSVLPIGDVGSGLFTTGLIGVALQYLDARDADQRDSDRLRKVLTEEAPAIRDAVVDGFAFSPEALTAVTSPEVLERVVQNCLTAQLADRDLAISTHAQLLRGAMAPPDRLYDGRLSVSLNKTAHHDQLRVNIRREYRFVPHVDVLRFACVARRDDYESLLRDPEIAEVWRTRTSDGIDAGDESAFVLTGVELDGQPQTFKRSVRKGAQAFTCRIARHDTEAAALSPGAAEATLHHLAYSYEVLVPRSKHCLYFDIGRPTKGLTIELDYDETLPEVRLLDFVGDQPDLRRARHLGTSGGDTSVATDDWVLPRAGVVAVWK